MPTQYVLDGKLSYPPDDGQPVALRPFSQSGSFDNKVEADLNLTGAGTHVVNFGTVGEAKVVMIEVSSDAAAPVNLLFNGGTDDVELGAGGFLAYCNPIPGTGVTAISIVHTNTARVQVRLLS